MTDQPSVVHDVLIVDDEPGVRQLVTAWIDLDPALRVVAAVGSAHDAVAVVASQLVDVVILDDDLGSGPEAVATAARLRQASSALLRIVLFSGAARWGDRVPGIDVAMPKSAIADLRATVRSLAHVRTPIVACTECGVGLPLDDFVIDLRHGRRELDCPACGAVQPRPSS